MSNTSNDLPELFFERVMELRDRLNDAETSKDKAKIVNLAISELNDNYEAIDRYGKVMTGYLAQVDDKVYLEIASVDNIVGFDLVAAFVTELNPEQLDKIDKKAIFAVQGENRLLIDRIQDNDYVDSTIEKFKDLIY